MYGPQTQLNSSALTYLYFAQTAYFFLIQHYLFTYKNLKIFFGIENGVHNNFFYLLFNYNFLDHSARGF